MEGLTIRAIVGELNAKLCGARLQQIYHPRPTTLTLELWAGSDYTLLLESGEASRIHLTSEAFRNPPVPSALAMILRKYIKNGVLRQVAQQGLERIVDLSIFHGEIYTLRCELLGKQSNIALLLGQKILGALKPTVGQRSFRPGDLYQPPPPQAKLDPFSARFADFCARLPQDMTLTKALVQIIDGIGPRLAQEIALRAQLDPAQPAAQLHEEEQTALWQAVQSLFAPAREQRFQPSLYLQDGKPVDAAPFPLKLYEHLPYEPRQSLSEALDECARAASQESTLEQESEALQRWLREKLSKTRAALKQTQTALHQAQHYAVLQREGELILAHLHKLQKGMTEVTLEDFLDRAARNIKLDPALSPVENAQKKFAHYKKLKRGEIKLQERYERLQQELQYLERVESALAQSETDLSAIHHELQARGYLEAARASKKSEKREAERAAAPRTFFIRGYRVLVGRSSKQNDALIRAAAREDYWLHARDRAGAHVIIKNPQQREIPPAVLEQAAQLAAYYSKGRDAKKVPVGYTRVKYLRKGARPGLVMVSQEEGTLLVTPQGDLQCT